jgi:hypothetical protein
MFFKSIFLVACSVVVFCRVMLFVVLDLMHAAAMRYNSNQRGSDKTNL